MGSFVGHVLPGCFFSVFGLWWIWRFWYLYFCSSPSRGQSVQDRYPLWLPCPIRRRCCLRWRCRPFVFEPLIKITFSCIGMVGELTWGEWTITDRHGNFIHLNNFEHATMFSFFLLSGVVEILVACRLPCQLPDGIDRLALCLAFTVEGLLFMYHLDPGSRSELDIRLHVLLCYAILGCSLSLLLELWHRDSILAVLTRAFFTSLQGSWFIQVAFILYGPSSAWWENSGHGKASTDFVGMAFCWHLFANSLVVLVLFYLTGATLTCRGRLNRIVTGIDQLDVSTELMKNYERQPMLNMDDDTQV